MIMCMYNTVGAGACRYMAMAPEQREMLDRKQTARTGQSMSSYELGDSD